MLTQEDVAKIAAAVIEAIGQNVPMHQKEILTLDEAAQYTGMKKSALYKLTSARQIPYSKPNGKMCFFKRTDIEDWMMSNPVATEIEINTRVMQYCMK